MPEPSSPFFVRTLTPADAEPLADLLVAGDRKPEAEAVRAGREGSLEPDENAVRWFAEGEGTPIGYARLSRGEYDEPGHHHTELVVRPDHRGRGVGARLWQTVVAEADVRKATRLRISLRDNDPAARGFAERRGFVFEGHLFESYLDLDTFVAPVFPTPEGMRVFSMADLPDNEENRRKLWRLNDWDLQPGEGAQRNFEQFVRDIFEGYWYRPDGQIVAAIGDEWVGLSAVGITAERRGYNMMTGTVPHHRGQGIATALKLASIDWARRQGARVIWTHNGSENAPMLAINRKLGYTPVPGWIRMTMDRDVP